MNYNTCARVRTHKNEVTFLAPWATWEALLVSVAVWAKLCGIEHCGEQFFVVDGDFGLDDATLSGLLDLRDSA
jgi:hypothetical protein